jgi:hypothetical protein
LILPEFSFLILISKKYPLAENIAQKRKMNFIS